jgi:glyoxylase-like metal-dependent hydrolase (beta-lactamase superfamily II)
MSDRAQINVLVEGYAGDRVASSVTLVRDSDLVIVIDPGMVKSQASILEPMAALGVDPASVTDVILSHHHPDHTINAGLFPNALIHDFWAIYDHDQWIDRESMQIGPSTSLLSTPGHTDQDISTVIETNEGVVVCTHAWWTVDGPELDPFSGDQSVLDASRSSILALNPVMIIPGHGSAFRPSAINFDGRC